MADESLLVGPDSELIEALAKSERFRDRHHLVIALGEGTKGKRLRSLLDRAAEHAGKPVSTWAREVLMNAALELVLAGKIDE